MLYYMCNIKKFVIIVTLEKRDIMPKKLLPQQNLEKVEVFSGYFSPDCFHPVWYHIVPDLCKIQLWLFFIMSDMYSISKYLSDDFYISKRNNTDLVLLKLLSF